MLKKHLVDLVQPHDGPFEIVGQIEGFFISVLEALTYARLVLGQCCAVLLDP